MATTPYLDADEFADLTLAPAAYIAEIEAAEPGWTLRQLVHFSAWIDSQLRKRYAIPFVAPFPETVLTWLCDIVTERVYLKVGIDATDKQLDNILQAAQRAREQVQLAANSVDGLFELPLRADDPASAVARGGPLAYTETSPYKWMTVQREIATDEDNE